MSAFDSLLPAGAITVEASAAMWESGLLAEEQTYIMHAVDKRRREFTAGRNCARQALQLLGLEAAAIHVGARRAPIFPAGVSGTITHTDGYCAASAIHSGAIRSIGIDAESNKPLDDSIRGLIMRPDERAMLARLPVQTLRHWDKLIFSAKESFYKAYFQLCQIELDFLDASVTIQPDTGTFVLRVWRSDVPDYFREQQFHGRYSVDSHRVYSAIALHDAFR